MMSVALAASASSPTLSEECAKAFNGFPAEREERTEEAPPCAEQPLLLFFAVLTAVSIMAIVLMVSMLMGMVPVVVMFIVRVGMRMRMMWVVFFGVVVWCIFTTSPAALSSTSSRCGKREILVFFIRNNPSLLCRSFSTCRYNVSRQRRLRHDYRSPWFSGRFFLG